MSNSNAVDVMRVHQAAMPLGLSAAGGFATTSYCMSMVVKDSAEPRFSLGTMEYPPSEASIARCTEDAQHRRGHSPKANPKGAQACAQCGYSGAIRDADRLFDGLQSRAVTRAGRVRAGRAFASAGDRLKEVAA